MGLEPIRLSTHAPQTCLSAYSSTLAKYLNIIHREYAFVNRIQDIFFVLTLFCLFIIKVIKFWQYFIAAKLKNRTASTYAHSPTALNPTLSIHQGNSQVLLFCRFLTTGVLMTLGFSSIFSSLSSFAGSFRRSRRSYFLHL